MPVLSLISSLFGVCFTQGRTKVRTVVLNIGFIMAFSWEDLKIFTLGSQLQRFWFHWSGIHPVYQYWVKLLCSNNTLAWFQMRYGTNLTCHYFFPKAKCEVSFMHQIHSAKGWAMKVNLSFAGDPYRSNKGGCWGKATKIWAAFQPTPAHILLNACCPEPTVLWRTPELFSSFCNWHIITSTHIP